ncbi:hypothetical protein PG984_015624 [Apiospora sp. TS-2023a]
MGWRPTAAGDRWRPEDYGESASQVSDSQVLRQACIRTTQDRRRQLLQPKRAVRDTRDMEPLPEVKSRQTVTVTRHGVYGTPPLATSSLTNSV